MILFIDKHPKFGSTFGSYGCSDFRPGREYLDEVALWASHPAPITGTITVTVGANDTRDLTAIAEVTIVEREEEWDAPSVLENLPPFLRSELQR